MQTHANSINGKQLPPEILTAQRNMKYGAYDKVPVFGPTYRRVGDQYVEGTLTSTSGSSSSVASHNIVTSMSPQTNRAHLQGGLVDPTTPPRYWPSNTGADTMPGNNSFQGSNSRFTEVRNRTSINPPVHYRTNFGKNCSYFPPATKSSPGRLPPEVPVVPRRDAPPSPKRLPTAVLENLARARSRVFNVSPTDFRESYAALPESGFVAGGRLGRDFLNSPNPSHWEDDDVPFDQQRDMFHPPVQSYLQPSGKPRNVDASLEVHQETPPRASQSDWEQSSPSRPQPLRPYYSETDESVTGRFQISPPRLTDPTPLPSFVKDDMDVVGPGELAPQTLSHAPGNRFFGRPLHETGYDSMEAECSPNRTQESTSLYSPYSQTTRGSHFKWPDDSPRSKGLESPSSRQRDNASLQSPASLRSVKDESPCLEAVSHPELQEKNLTEEKKGSKPHPELDIVPVDLGHHSEIDRGQPKATMSHQKPLSNHHLQGAQGPNYPSLVSMYHESDSQEQSEERSEAAQSVSEKDQCAGGESTETPIHQKRKSSPPLIKIVVDSQIEVEGSWDASSKDGEVRDPDDEVPTSSALDEPSPRSIRKKDSLNTDDDSIFVFTDDDKPSKALSPSNLSPSNKLISPKHSQPRKPGQATQRRGRRRAANDSDGDEDEDDDTSLDNDYGVARKRSSSLQERTQQAWASRKNAAHRSQSIPVKRTIAPNADSVTASPRRRFDEDETTAGATGITGDPSFAGSLNSLYTKTLESEVEDAIKDLLLIGTGRATNPGRRMNKFQPGIKRRENGGEDNSSPHEDEATEFTPLDDETEDVDDTIQGEKKEADNPIQLMWEYMEGNLSVLGSAFGLSTEAKPEAKPKQKKTARSSSSTDGGSSFSPKEKPAVREKGRIIKSKAASTKPRNHDYGDEGEYITTSSKPQETSKLRMQNRISSSTEGGSSSVPNDDSEVRDQQRGSKRPTASSNPRNGTVENKSIISNPRVNKSRTDNQEQNSHCVEELSTELSETTERDRSLMIKSTISKPRNHEMREEAVYRTISSKPRSHDHEAESERNSAASKSAGHDYREECTNIDSIPRNIGFGDEVERNQTGTKTRLVEGSPPFSERQKIDFDDSPNVIVDNDPHDEEKTIGTRGTYAKISVCNTSESETHAVEESRHSSPVTIPIESQKAKASSTPRIAKLEEDPRLIELALEAARSLHQLAGVEFDDSTGIDIVEDIKFSIIKLALPLGILFQENYGGCWVTRILPSGNAARIGGVELGDQLAAVNGMSAIRAKVDEVCTLVSEAPDPSAVELTFLRYIGPLRSLPAEVEGIEDEIAIAIDDDVKRDHCQTENVFSCVMGAMKDEETALTQLEETSRREEKPRQELSELQPSSTVTHSKTVPREKVPEGKRRFRFFGLGRKKQPASSSKNKITR